MQVSEIFVKIGLKVKGLQEGLAKAEKTVKKSAENISASIQKSEKKSENSFKNLGKAAADAAVGVSTLSFKMAALGYVAARALEYMYRGSTTISNLARSGGMDAAQLRLNALAAAFSNAGISSEDASQQLAAFGQNIFDLQHGFGNAQGFQLLQSFGKGVSWFGKTTDQLIEDVGSKLKELGDQQATAVLRAFGFSPEMLDFFRLSAEGKKEIQDKSLIGAEDLKNMKEASQELSRLGIVLSDLGSVVLSVAAPAISNLAENIRDLTKWLLPFSRDFREGFQEKVRGFFGDTPPPRGKRLPEITELKPGYNNPGNLRGPDGEFRKFDTVGAGLSALYSDIKTKVSGKSPAMASKFGKGYTPTLSNLLHTYAPPEENDTKRYIDFVAGKTGIDPHRKLTEGDIDGIVKSIVKMEGNKNVNFNNVYNIHGVDGEGISRSVTQMQKEQIQRSHALSDLNNSAR